MSEQQLLDLVEMISNAADSEFAARGAVPATWVAVTAAGEKMVQRPPTDDKDFNAALMRALFEAADVVRYVYVDEAWTLTSTSKEAIARASREGLADHPDRREVLMITGEDRDAGQVMTHRDILRPKRGKAHLGPLVRDDFPQSEGRMVGLLRPAGRAN
jgi:hypothetical protein